MKNLGAESVEIIKNIQYNIGMNLIKTKKRPCIKFKVEINKELENTLKIKYFLNGRFKNCPSFLRDFKIIYSNYYNDTDFHSIKLDTFELKLTKQKKINLISKVRNKLKAGIIYSKPSLTIKFVRNNVVNLNESELNSLTEYRKSYKNE